MIQRSFDALTAFSRNTAPLHAPLAYGAGARVVDVEGREYVDCCAQTLNTNLGQCHPSVVEAVTEQLQRLTCVSSRFSSDVALELHEKLVELTPRPLTKVNLASVTGSAANECALKAARRLTGRRMVVALDGSHHGQTFETMRTSGKHWDVDYLGERSTRFLPTPQSAPSPFADGVPAYDVRERLEEIWAETAGDVAAVIVEPIMLDAGVIVPHRAYHEALRAFCDERDVVLIFDEIQTAFGWLGAMFAMEVYGVVPDVVTLGKGLGAGFPIAATVMRDDLDVLGYGEHEMTGGAHVTSCAASLAMLRWLRVDGRLDEVRRKGELVAERFGLLAERFPAIRAVRGHGLLLGIEIAGGDRTPDPELARRLFHALLERGVIMRLGKVGGASSVLQFKPPLVIEDEDLEYVFNALEAALVATT